MQAIDTNVLARFFVNDPDDPQAAAQRPAATQAMSGRVLVSVTVLLEFEWVLRGFYQLPRRQVAQVLQALAGMDNVTLESRDEVLTALAACASPAVDFADALHLARSTRCAAFVTFDRKLARRAGALGLGPPVALLA